jgi:biotin carboxyl carrier protein
MTDDDGTGRRSAVPAEGARIVDPRSVRVRATSHPSATGSRPMVIEPSVAPVATVAPASAIVDGTPLRIRLEQLGASHAVLTEPGRDGPVRTRVLLMPLERGAGPRADLLRRELVVDGWRVEVEIESEQHASLRERARRGREETGQDGSMQVRAIIPGRIVSVSIVPGDPVVAGQQLLVVEAMKMQNELRAPRDGIVASVAVAAGGTIEVGDLMLVLE